MSIEILASLAEPSVVDSAREIAKAYVGPGAGLSAIGALAALIGAGGIMLVGFVWYPLKKLLRRRKPERVEDADETANAR